MITRKYNRRIAVEMPTRAPNGQGGFTKGWSEPVPIWAEVIPLRGGEAVEHNVLHGTQLYRVTIRFREDVTTACRLIHEGKPLNIRTCEDLDGRRRDLVMTAESGVKS